MKIFLLYIYLSIFVSVTLSSQEPLPTSTTGQIIRHTYFTLSYAQQHKQAEWVYYELTPKVITGSQSRTDNFRPDPKVTTGSAQLSDYRGSGYDRGHLCPAGDMRLNHTSMSETFYLSNMSPQEPSFNRGIWSTLESIVRNWAITEGMIYVVTGGVLTSNKGAIGANRVTVPRYYYKVIYEPETPKMIGFILPNERGTRPIENYVVSVDSVEVITGIDFFPQLEDSLQQVLESYSNPTLWSFEPYRSSSTTTKKSVSVQCKGIAKSTGVRCRNMTTNENGYCYLHQDQDPNYVKKDIIETSSPDGRCMAITQAGTRCKRNAVEGSKYCWQHENFLKLNLAISFILIQECIN